MPVSTSTRSHTHATGGTGASGGGKTLNPETVTATRASAAAPVGVDGVIDVVATGRGTRTIGDRIVGVKASMSDGSGVADRTITGATNATPIVITTSVAHGYSTGETVNVWGVGGNTAANDDWVITVLSPTTFSLDGSVGNGAYTSGGTVTNRPMMTALAATVIPNIARGGMTANENADDVNGVVIYNSGAVKATDALFISANPAIVGAAWDAGIVVNANASKGINFNADYDVGIDLSLGTYTTAPIRLAGNAEIIAGTGTPEGVVTAPVGSIFLRTDGGAGTSFYVKQSGTGNTGWAAK